VIWVKGKPKYFLQRIWTGQISLNAKQKSRFSRSSFFGNKAENLDAGNPAQRERLVR
jgi:hypothetical protein